MTCVFLWFAQLLGCVAVPVHRPIAPALGEHVAEVGVAPNAMFARDQMGVGGAAWTAVQVYPDVDVLAHGFFTDIFRYDGQTRALTDTFFGGGLGVRGRYALLEHLTIGAEALVEYDQRTGGAAPEQLVTFIGGLPVAEQAFPGFWV
jgi:hypothetical protein